MINPVKKLINIGSLSKYPIKANNPNAKQTIAIIPRLRGGLLRSVRLVDVVTAGSFFVVFVETLELVEAFFFPLACAT
jgi:hypothetical protein